MNIIPAIDIIDGKCVRLTQGDYTQKKVYNENPIEVALSFEDAGLRHLHLVDLDGAKAGKVTNWNVIRDIVSQTGLTVDFGGGIKTQDEITKLLDLGVQKVNLGSIAVKQPGLVKEWIAIFSPERIVLSADVKGERIAISGWQEAATLGIDELLKDYLDAGLDQVTCTDISTDGMLSGPNIVLYTRLLNDYPTLRLIASGGVSSLEDLKQLRQTGVYGVIVGKAIYEGKVRLKDLVSLERDIRNQKPTFEA